jgi:hypothetical protein
VATEFLQRHGLANRITTHGADMFRDAFPPADVHFYSNVFHDWPPDRARFLVAKSFDSLPAGGLIIIHEMLLNDDKTGPTSVAGFNIQMLAGMLGQQFSGPELRQMLEDAGFREVGWKRTFGDCCVVIGKKPA